MAADYDIYTLLHQESCPFLFIFGRHGFHFFAPVSNKNQYITVCLCLFNHGCNFVFFENIDHVISSVSGTGIVRSVCIIQKRNFNAVYFESFDCIGIFFGIMDTKNRNIRVTGLPEIQCLCHVIIAIIINVVGGRFDDIKSGIDQCVADFRRCCEGWITTDCIMLCGENSFLIDHGNICRLNFALDIFIDCVIVPCAGIRFT